MTNEIIVSIICYTYNQKQYIKDALEGFLKQKTIFPYEILIHDDASTDGTTEILKEYQKNNREVIRLILEKENQYSQGKDLLKDIVLPYVKGKYLAFCEGDDFWIYENKLQKQFDLMEANPNISLCYHNALVYQEETDILKLNIENHSSGYIEDKDIIYASKGWYPTASAFCRTQDVREQPDFKASTGDAALRTYMACRGDLYFINRAWSVYRDFATGSWNEKYRHSKKVAAQYIVDTVNYYTEFNKYSKGRFTKYFPLVYMGSVKRFFNVNYVKGYTVEQLEEELRDLKVASDHAVDAIIDQFHDEYIIQSIDYYNNTIKYKIKKLYQAGHTLYIYGTGAEAIRAAVSLIDNQIYIKGFIVSKKTEKIDTLLTYPIYCVEKVSFDDNMFVWPCLINGRSEVLKILKEKHPCKIVM